MNNYPCTTSNPYRLACFIYKNKEYHISQKSLLRDFPTVGLYLDYFLYDYGYTYTLLSSGCRIEPTNVEMEELTLPVYVLNPVKGAYVLTDKKHTVLIPTKAAYEEACKLRDEILALYEEYLVAENEKQFEEVVTHYADEALKLLDGKDACFISRFPKVILPPEGYEFKQLWHNILSKYDILITRMYTRCGYGEFLGYAIINISRISGKEVFKMKVADDVNVGLVIGKQGLNIETLVNAINFYHNLNIKRISVYQ